MKTSLLTMGLAAVVMGASPMPARAINTEWAAVAGFSGGVLYEDLGCGSRRKIWQPGYFQTVRNKVWVDSGRGCGPCL